MLLIFFLKKKMYSTGQVKWPDGHPNAYHDSPRQLELTTLNNVCPLKPRCDFYSVAIAST